HPRRLRAGRDRPTWYRRREDPREPLAAHCHWLLAVLLSGPVGRPSAVRVAAAPGGGRRRPRPSRRETPRLRAPLRVSANLVLRRAGHHCRWGSAAGHPLLILARTGRVAGDLDRSVHHLAISRPLRPPGEPS